MEKKKLPIAMKKILFLVIGALITLRMSAQTFETVTWNLESGDANISFISEAIIKMQEENPVEIWGFSEVEPKEWERKIENALEESGKDYRTQLGSTGRNDRLLMAYDSEKFILLESDELHYINPGGRVRSPLVGKFKEKESGKIFYYVVNHLYRGSKEGRQEQSKLLKEWAKTKAEEVIMVGDFNYDWDIDKKKGNQAFNIFMEGKVMKWIQPKEMVKTSCHKSYNSILDFIFTKSTSGWCYKSEIVKVEDNCPDTQTVPDHKPVKGYFK